MIKLRVLLKKCATIACVWLTVTINFSVVAPENPIPILVDESVYRVA